MKQIKQLIALFLLLALTLSLGACGGNATPTATEPSTEPATEPTDPPVTANSLYSDAIAALEAAKEGAYEISICTTRHSGDVTTKSEESRILRYSGLGTAGYAAMVDSKTTICDTATIPYREVYSEGVIYWFIPNELLDEGQEPTLFSCKMDAETYQKRLLPLRLLNPALYSSAVIEAEGRLIFTEPSEPEAWLDPESNKSIQLTNAKGEVQLDSDGAFVSETYEISYIQGFIEVEQTYTIRHAAGQTEPNTTLPNREKPVELENMDLPYLLSLSSHLADSISGCSTECSIMEVIVSEAGGAVQIRNNDMYSRGSDADYMAKINTSVNITQGSESYAYETEETLQDGTGSYSVNGEVQQVYDNADPSAFQDYISSEANAYLPLPEHIEYAELSEFGGYWKIRFAGNKLYSLYLEDIASYNMFEDKDLLDNLAEAYATDLLEGYLYIDQDTLLPAALSIQMESRHKIEGYFFALNLNADQTFDYGDRDVYEEITGEMYLEEEPEEKATPVFYEVTSPEGQTMYLMGTIHVGDERTAYLPQEIYDAFDSSDALAVELDILTLYDRMEEDEELQDSIAASYYYSDGTGAKQHLPDEQYEQLMDMARFCGMSAMADGMYPSVVTGQFTNRLLFGSNTLSSLQGVDRRFLTMARDRDMEILEVESAELQFGLDAQYTDLVQKYMVMDAADIGRNDYVAHTIDLYEMWCSGDEATLREYLLDDGFSEDGTEEALQASEEYNNIMHANRDAGMLEKAKEYLASGKTVFFAVGLAHLLGETGLVDALREAGYTVTLIEYAE